MQKYILTIDQGTTGTTALLLNEKIEVVGRATEEFPQHFPKPGWVEHDLDEIWDSVLGATQRALRSANLEKEDIAAIAVTNQRETTCLWYRDSPATPLGRAIVWQDRRTEPHCARLRKRGLGRTIQKKTGLVIDPYFSATKLSWMLENRPKARTLARKGRLLFGTIDSYLLFRMTGEHRTEPSNASRTLLMDLKKGEWDADLLKLFKIPKTLLPEIFPSSVEYGKVRNVPFALDGTPVMGLAGDQQAALFGQACFKKGMSKCTYGTGAFVLTHVGERPVYSKHRLLSTVGWKLGDKTTYCLEGSAFIAGAAVQWLRDGLSVIDSASEIEALARSVADSGGVVFVPALSGLGAPHWNANARGMISGLTRGTTKAHLARATLEGVAYQVAELLSAMGKDLGRKVQPLKVDGGASANALLMQFQSDLLGVEVVRSHIRETTALGSALQAGLAIGMWKNTAEIERRWKADERFRPKVTSTQRRKKLQTWDDAIQACTTV